VAGGDAVFQGVEGAEAFGRAEGTVAGVVDVGPAQQGTGAGCGHGAVVGVLDLHRQSRIAGGVDVHLRFGQFAGEGAGGAGPGQGSGVLTDPGAWLRVARSPVRDRPEDS